MTDPKIIAAMLRAVRPLLGITDEEMEALYQAALNLVDPDEEWREAEEAFATVYYHDDPLLDTEAKKIIAALKQCVLVSPPYKALAARLEEAVDLLIKAYALWGIAAPDSLGEQMRAYLAKHKEQQP